MEDIRSGNLRVKKMKEEIECAVVMLKCSYITKRSQRQILDGTKFLARGQSAPPESAPEWTYRSRAFR